ncbi:putative RelA/SpoT protein [Lasiodiplodia theobromae]|nr:putative RelA/SpoT protein [Lasiodiplodia theobromae]
MADETPSVISNFLKQYDKEWYRKLAKFAEDLCRVAMEPIGIPAFFEHRAKDEGSLRDKLIQRHRERPYRGSKEIRQDIVDLAGVRIVLYMPQHTAAVENRIRTTFELQTIKEHPDSGEGSLPDKRYSGYQAKHYRVLLIRSQLEELKAPTHNGEEPLVEIQVVSILHNVWANFQHDVEYKSLGGKASEEERSVLDLLNGLMQLGEKHLEKLHDINIKRIQSRNKPFANKWELGTWLSNWLSQNMSPKNVNLGPIEVLRRFIGLDDVAQDTPDKLELVLETIKFGDDWPLALQEMSDRLYQEKRASILIIAHILRNKLPHDKTPRSFAVLMKPQPPCENKIQAMASAFIWLHELFPPSRWEQEVTEYARSRKQTEAVEWLLTKVSARTVMGKEIKYDDTIKRRVEKLWKWMEDSFIDVLCLSFSISKLGVNRQFPKEDEFMKLRAVYGVLKNFL